MTDEARLDVHAYRVMWDSNIDKQHDKGCSTSLQEQEGGGKEKCEGIDVRTRSDGERADLPASFKASLPSSSLLSIESLEDAQHPMGMASHKLFFSFSIIILFYRRPV